MKTELVGLLVGVIMDEHGNAYARIKHDWKIYEFPISSKEFLAAKVGSIATITITV